MATRKYYYFSQGKNVYTTVNGRKAVRATAYRTILNEILICVQREEDTDYEEMLLYDV